jgi:hypothetical protein
MLKHQDEFQINHEVSTTGTWVDLVKIENYQMRSAKI